MSSSSGGKRASSWHAERWDSLRLLTPNWMNEVAGSPYDGPDPDGYMSGIEFADRLESAAMLNGAPVMTETRVLSLDQLGGGYRVQTDRGVIVCESVVIATGECAVPKVPRFADALPASVVQLTPQSYKRPSDVPAGGVLVVGASASGLQIARELNASGREVTLAVGNHLRLPRRYRGADILWWMHRTGDFDVPHTRVDDLDRLRRIPSLPLSGDASMADIDLNGLQDLGIEIVGRLASVTDGTAWFSGSLAHACASADLKLDRLLDRIDAFAKEKRIVAQPPCRLPATRVPEAPRLALRLGDSGHPFRDLGDRIPARPQLGEPSGLRRQGSPPAPRRSGGRRPVRHGPEAPADREIDPHRRGAAGRPRAGTPPGQSPRPAGGGMRCGAFR